MSENEQDQMVGALYVKRDKQAKRLACVRLKVDSLLRDVESVSAEALAALRYYAA